MFKIKKRCPKCGEVIDDDCYCFACGTSFHKDEAVTSKKEIHKKVSGEDLDSENMGIRDKIRSAGTQPPNRRKINTLISGTSERESRRRFIESVEGEEVRYSITTKDKDKTSLVFDLLFMFFKFYVISFIFKIVSQIAVSLFLSSELDTTLRMVAGLFSAYSYAPTTFNLLILQVLGIRLFIRRVKSQSIWCLTSTRLYKRGNKGKSKSYNSFPREKINKFYAKGNALYFEWEKSEGIVREVFMGICPDAESVALRFEQY